MENSPQNIRGYTDIFTVYRDRHTIEYRPQAVAALLVADTEVERLIPVPLDYSVARAQSASADLYTRNMENRNKTTQIYNT